MISTMCHLIKKITPGLTPELTPELSQDLIHFIKSLIVSNSKPHLIRLSLELTRDVEIGLKPRFSVFVH